MSKFQVSLLDADGTIFEKHKCWSQLDNNNENALTPEFIETLRGMSITPWFADNIHKWRGNVNIVVTGRLPEHKEVTMEAIHDAFLGDKENWSFVSSKWDDTIKDNKAAYNDYVERKVDTLAELYCDWRNTLNSSGMEYEIRVYEDDENVLKYIKRPGLKLFLMNEDGTKATPYGEK